MPAQVAMPGSSGSDLELHIVNTTNTLPTAGSSVSGLAVTNFQQEQAFAASSSAPNHVKIIH